ncbi:MAG TPA: hypothetical protein VFG54_21145 [Prolixibacteraceae bacterium]|nr:hypothetical protein [Prolixibacteraceae bacterium]
MTKLTGKVVAQKFGEGSKSEHDAVYLDTGDKKYRLKKKGGNPFYDESLHKLVGKTIELEGDITPGFFVIKDEPEE